MSSPENTPAPWYRTLTTRTPRGRKLRRRLALALVVLTLPYTINALLGWDPNRVGALLGRRIPGDCHRGRDCEMKCEHAHAVCLNAGDAKDPRLGICVCPTREEVERWRRALPETCLDPVLASDDGETRDWKCSARVPPNGGDGGP